jgi:hypothetical protein
MKQTNRTLFALMLYAGLTVTPSYPAQNQASGVVIDAEGAHVGEAPISQGASLFAGDVVDTDSEGHAQLRVRQTRFELIGQSKGAFFAAPNGAVAILRHGTMVVALTSPSETFEIFASDVRIVPKGPGPYLAQITMNSDCDLQIKVQKGSLEATAGKETKTLEESHAYDVIPEVSVNDTRNPAISPDEATFHRGHSHASCALAAKFDSKPTFAGNSHFKIIAGVIAAGILIPVILHTTGQNNAPESPFVP